MAVTTTRGRADSDEDDIGVCDGPCQIKREAQAAGSAVMGDDRFEPRLEDRHFTALQRLDLISRLVDTDHFVTEIREAGSRHQADITRTDHHNAHSTPIPTMIASGAAVRSGYGT